MARKVLISFLGKGQANLVNKDKIDYRKTTYFNYPNKEICFTTPFVSEAIIQLNKDKLTFDEIFILGTHDSMWDTIFAHCISDNIDDFLIDTFDIISKEVKNRDVSKNSLKIIDEKFSQITAVKTTSKIINIGKNNDEIWSIFESIVSIPQENDIISIDITYGLRFQTFFSVLALVYIKQVKKNIQIGNVFYGAFELSSDFNNLSPIYDLKPMLDLLEWINAGSVFQKYGDISQFIELLQQESVSENFIIQSKKYAESLQLNNVESVKSNSSKFLNEFNLLLDAKLYKPLSFISDLIKEFPKQIISKNNSWETMWLMSERYYKNGQLAFATLILYESVISRIAKIYKNAGAKINEKKFEDARFCSDVSSNQFFPEGTENASLTRFYTDNELVDFVKYFRNLKNYRNGIAHIRGNNKVDITNLPRDFPKMFKYFQNNLGNMKLVDLPNHLKHITQ